MCHIAQVIAPVRRKCPILHSILPTELLELKVANFLAPVDKIARGCRAMTYLSDSTVPLD